jgi:hypothetical protein
MAQAFNNLIIVNAFAFSVCRTFFLRLELYRFAFFVDDDLFYRFCA